MPEISRFLGIIIAMFYNDHNPPHFFVRYNEHKANISIKNLAILDGKLPPKVLGLVIEWASIHQSELLKNWELARASKPLNKVFPLE
ncbi:MAG: DUF4160 domain-containing protein [Gammaproteobacteria bacterium]|nr:DUF4160 domain-containing protein [Gammaproteobacteria bacterium]